MIQAYIDCGSGVAGDMLLGALLGLGLPVAECQRVLFRAIGEKGWNLQVEKVHRQGWPALAVQVKGDRPFGSPAKMQQRVRASRLAGPIKRNADAILKRLQTAEQRVHGGKSGSFDSDGLGLLDTLVDVVGCCWGFWKLGLSDVMASPLNTGRLAPASAWMLQDRAIPAYTTDSQRELATPTGIAILCELARQFGPMPVLNLQVSGYGAGTFDSPERPNVLAIHQGEMIPGRHPGEGRGLSIDGFRLTSHSYDLIGRDSPPDARGTTARMTDDVVLLETNIDDMDPRLYPHVSDLLFKAGALDVWWAPIGMKKGRPGIAFSVLCRPEEESRLAGFLFQETTTLGIRRCPLQRWVLPRTVKGRRKIACLPDGTRRSRVEFERVKIEARSRSIPLQKLLK